MHTHNISIKKTAGVKDGRKEDLQKMGWFRLDEVLKKTYDDSNWLSLDVIGDAHARE
ncbi:MAG: hypothetical protein NVSMB49_11140 [Ktedonobacteraceae bacterium]